MSHGYRGRRERPTGFFPNQEREYVTRAGTATPFWWGSTITPELANFNGTFAYAGTTQKGEYRAKTVPVWSFQPNAWDLYQLHGNVWEWVEDCWHGDYNGAPPDGTAWTTGDSCRHVLRGGAWDRISQLLTSASRISFSAAFRYNMIGFRVAKLETRGLLKLPPRPKPPVTLASQPSTVPPRHAAPSLTLASSPPPPEQDGWVDEWKFDDGNLVIRGWGLWQPQLGAQMMMNTNLPVDRVSIKVVPRPDVVTAMNNQRLDNSGFEVTVYLDKAKPMPETENVCLWTDDPAFGRRRLRDRGLCTPAK